MAQTGFLNIFLKGFLTNLSILQNQPAQSVTSLNPPLFQFTTEMGGSEHKHMFHDKKVLSSIILYAQKNVLLFGESL